MLIALETKLSIIDKNHKKMKEKGKSCWQLEKGLVL